MARKRPQNGGGVDDEPPRMQGDERNQRRASSIDAHVGARVRVRRMILGLSQERLADQLGLTFQQVQKYEKGVNRIGASRLFDLSRVLDVPVQFFYDDMAAAGDASGPGLAESGSEPFVVDYLDTREGLELNKAFARVTDPKVRRAIVELVRALADGPLDEVA